MNILVVRNSDESCIPTIRQYDQRNRNKENKMDEMFTMNEGDKKCMRTDFNSRKWKNQTGRSDFLQLDVKVIRINIKINLKQ
jgi:hypothetical protein